MSLHKVRAAIRSALADGLVTGAEMKKIAHAAESDGPRARRVSKGEAGAISRFVEGNYLDAFTRAARRESDSFFDRNGLPKVPARVTTYGPAGEEDGGGWASTQAVGEEDGGGRVTTFGPAGEEDGGGWASTQAVGEEDGGGRVTTFGPAGEEDGWGSVR